MKILIFGSDGYIGSRLSSDLTAVHTIIGTYHTKPGTDGALPLDITNEDSIASCIDAAQPDVIIHLANQVSSRWCEDHPDAAMAINQRSTELIVSQLKNTQIKLLYLSSYAAYMPSNVYARTKIASEEIIRSSLKNYLLIRPSAIFGYSPYIRPTSLFGTLVSHIRNLTTDAIDTSWKFQLCYLGHLSSVVRELLSTDINAEMINVATPELTTIYDVYADIGKTFGCSFTKSDEMDTIHFSKAYPLTKLEEYHLPLCSYHEAISNMTDEIRSLLLK
jgi:dTDP-4-dehydrorhamnose reductase